jgi:tetratricopeptide (TPR) repeat protein
VLFECLTGRRAFDGSSTSDVFGQILRVHPPPVSSLRSDLQERHDELCRRLLAKDPADRFQSADEVVGAIRLLVSDSSRDTQAPLDAHAPGGGTQPALSEAVTVGAGTPVPGVASRDHPGTRPGIRPWIHARRRFFPVLAVLMLSAAALAGWWGWSAMRTLPTAPADAARWYQRGVEAIREGAYHSGQRALEEAIRRFPNYPMAYARLAETLAELDDERGAQAQLLRLSSVLPDELRLPEDDRLRLQGTRALVLRDLDASLAAYQRLVERHAGDAPTWLDLGRVQEAAGRRTDARASYAKATAIDPQYAAAHLRLGYVEGQESNRDEALRAFGESERLYRAAANTEGETEVLLRRGGLYYVMGDFTQARVDLERATGLASTLKVTHQTVRAQLTLSGVTAAEGRFAESERMAAAAVQEALNAGLDTVAADGLIDLTATLMEADRIPEAVAQGERALQLAERRGARRTAARARVQLASVRLQEDKPKDALALVEGAVAFLKDRRERRFEIYGLLIMSRAYQMLDDLERARAASADVVATAEAMHDNDQLAIALSNLASVASSLGQLPQALAHRERAEAIRRGQNDASALPYDLANRAELLIRLGRFDDADRVLDELEAGIAAGIEAYAGRGRRAKYLRALADVVSLRCEDALQRLGGLAPSSQPDSVSAMAPVLLDFAHARLRIPARGSGQPAAAADSSGAPFAGERYYWRAAAALERGRAAAALTEAERGLALLGKLPNDELRWRLAALGAASARSLGQADTGRAMRASAQEALARLRSDWPAGVDLYLQRPDLAELTSRLGPS